MASQNNSERIAIFIDGNNFYKYLKDKEISFPKGTIFDFDKFIDFLSHNRTCVVKKYYVGIARNIDGSPKSQSLVKGQQKFLSKLQKSGFIIERGRVMYDKGRIREKGTDVKIAVDLLMGAINNAYDTAILISSDTDLIPAIKEIKNIGKKLEYVGFSHAPSFGIQKYATFSVLLLPKDIENFKVPTLL